MIYRASHPIDGGNIFDFSTWDGGHSKLVYQDGWHMDEDTSTARGVFSVSCVQEPGTVALHRWIGPSGDRYRSTDPGAADNSGYQYYGTIGFVMPP